MPYMSKWNSTYKCSVYHTVSFLITHSLYSIPSSSESSPCGSNPSVSGSHLVFTQISLYPKGSFTCSCKGRDYSAKVLWYAEDAVAPLTTSAERLRWKPFIFLNAYTETLQKLGKANLKMDSLTLPRFCPSEEGSWAPRAWVCRPVFLLTHSGSTGLKSLITTNA